MAELVPIPGKSDCSARLRAPGLVVLWTVLTLGLYGIWWWYTVNRELCDVGVARRADGFGDRPERSALALALGGFALFVPTVWTLVTTFRRLQRLQRLVGVEPSDGRVFAALAVLTCGLGSAAYLQSGLNRGLRGQVALPTAPPLTEAELRMPVAA